MEQKNQTLKDLNTCIAGPKEFLKMDTILLNIGIVTFIFLPMSVFLNIILVKNLKTRLFLRLLNIGAK